MLLGTMTNWIISEIWMVWTSSSHEHRQPLVHELYLRNGRPKSGQPAPVHGPTAVPEPGNTIATPRRCTGRGACLHADRDHPTSEPNAAKIDVRTQAPRCSAVVSDGAVGTTRRHLLRGQPGPGDLRSFRGRGPETRTQLGCGVDVRSQAPGINLEARLGELTFEANDPPPTENGVPTESDHMPSRMFGVSGIIK
jgi:hypothetical protein